MSNTELTESLVNKETGLSEREEYFLDKLFGEADGDFQYAMKLAGYPPSFSVASVRKKLSKHIKQLTKDYLVSETPRAASSLVRLLRDPMTPGGDKIIKAAAEILNRGDVNKEEAKFEMPENVIILLPPKKTKFEGLIIDHQETETNESD